MYNSHQNAILVYSVRNFYSEDVLALNRKFHFATDF